MAGRCDAHLLRTADHTSQSPRQTKSCAQHKARNGRKLITPACSKEKNEDYTHSALSKFLTLQQRARVLRCNPVSHLHVAISRWLRRLVFTRLCLTPLEGAQPTKRERKSVASQGRIVGSYQQAVRRAMGVRRKSA